jgi:hypothetical protein
MSKDEILTLKEPFTFNELKKIGILTTRKKLRDLVQEKELKTKKIGRMQIYWRKTPQEAASTGLTSYTRQLELELEELRRDVMSEREKVRKLSLQEGIDDPWKETAMSMARILSEQKQVSLQEVLEYFNAPLEEQ